MVYAATEGRQWQSQRASVNTIHKCDNQGVLAIISTGIVKQRTHRCMLSQLTRSTCPRLSGICLCQDRRKCGRSIHQTSSNTEAPKVHGGGGAAPVLKKSYLGFIHFIRITSFHSGLTLFRLDSLYFYCTVGRPSKVTVVFFPFPLSNSHRQGF